MASYSDKNIHICGMEEPDVLPLDTVLYYGFGGYTVKKDGEMYYEGDPQGEWEDYKTLEDIENVAKKYPKSIWEVVLYSPLEGATWERNRRTGIWFATEKNQGFA